MFKKKTEMDTIQLKTLMSSEDWSNLPPPPEPKQSMVQRRLAAVSRDPVAIVGILLVIAELFTRISLDVVMSLVLIGILVFYAGNKKE